MYPDDLTGNSELGEQIGHIEHSPDGFLRWPLGSLPLIKTHHYPLDNNPAIYVVRDGRAACASLCKFENMNVPLMEIITGKHELGGWASHLDAWRPWARPDTLLLRYEDMTTNLGDVLSELSRFLDKGIIKNHIPGRESMAAVDGRYIRRKSDWREIFTDVDVEVFNNVHGEMMRRMGYS